MRAKYFISPTSAKYTMNIEIKNHTNADLFAIIFQHLKSFSEHVNVVFEASQMFVQCMDTSRVSIMEIRLPAEWFDVYEHTHSTSITIGLNANILFRVLNARDKTQDLNIKYTMAEEDKLFVNFTSGAKKEFDKHFEMPLIDVESDTMEIPAIDFQAELTLPSAHFASIVGQLKQFGDTMEIQCSENKIMLVSHSQDQGKMFVEINIDDVSGFAIEEGANLELSYSLSYMSNICQYNKLSKEVELKFSNEYPMQVVYGLGLPNAHVMFYLAPKINDE